MPDCIEAFRQLEQKLGGRPDSYPEWVCASMALNQDMSEPQIDVAEEQCDAMREVALKYGKHIAKQLYDSQRIVIAQEILAAGEYLHLNGNHDDAEAIANIGVFLEFNEFSYEAKTALVSHMNAGGSVELAFLVLKQAEAASAPAEEMQTM